MRNEDDLLMTNRMENPFIAVKIFPCPTCNWPLVVSSRFEVRPDDDVLDGEQSRDLHCAMCGWRGTLLGDRAEWRKVVEWNLEIDSEHHINKTK